MKKVLIAVLLVLAMAVPVFAQDSDEMPGKLQAEAALGIILPTYSKLIAFQCFTSNGTQFSYQYPLSEVYPGETLYAHIQLEFAYLQNKKGTRLPVDRVYTLTVTGPGFSYTDSVTYTTYVGDSGERWQAIRIPTETMPPGYYKVSMKISVKGLGAKVLKSAIRIY